MAVHFTRTNFALKSLQIFIGKAIRKSRCITRNHIKKSHLKNGQKLHFLLMLIYQRAFNFQKIVKNETFFSDFQN